MRELKKKTITQERLKEVLKYDPEIGHFVWKIKKTKWMQHGMIAGSINTGGYLQIKIDSHIYLAHRLAWLFMEGFIPKNIIIDHIDRNKLNNSWKNLRLASHACNSRNRKKQYNNSSGVVGVSFNKISQKWAVNIYSNNNQIYLGSFESFKDAVKTRWKAEKKYKYINCDSTSTVLINQNLI